MYQQPFCAQEFQCRNYRHRPLGTILPNMHKCNRKGKCETGPLSLLLYFPHNHHYARMDKWLRLPWELAMTRENYKRGMNCLLIISFIKLSLSTIKAPKEINPFTPTFWKAHSSSQSYSLNLGFPTTLVHIS